MVYNYDAGGNITSKIEYPYTTGSLGTATKTANYGYGDSNWKDKLTSYDGKSITCNPIGNPLNDGTYSYTWEQGRQLKTTAGNGQNISYKYNDAGIRTQKVVNGVTTDYHLEGDKVTYESNGTDKIYYTYDSEDKLLSMNLNGAEYYYIRNAQNDIIGLFDKTGIQVVSYIYDTWGKLIAIDGSLKDSVGVKNPYRYRGYRYDTETGLYYLNARYYNAEWGRFINADGIVSTPGELLSGNMFAYCSNNPVNFWDPSGKFLFALPFIVAAVFVVIVAVVTFIAIKEAVKTVADIVQNTWNTHRLINKMDNAPQNNKTNVNNKKTNSSTNKNKSKLPNQGAIKGNVKDAPPVDAGSQKKHVPMHPGSIKGKSQWPEGENGVDLTQEGWMKGRTVKKQPGEEVRVWDTGKVIGPNGETRVKVHMRERTGTIHGYPVP